MKYSQLEKNQEISNINNSDLRKNNQASSRQQSNIKRQNKRSSRVNNINESQSYEKAEHHNKFSLSDQVMNRERKIFEGLTFFLEVFEKEISIINEVQPLIIEKGGQIIKQLQKNTDFYVYNNGRPQTLKKVALNQDYNHVKIVNLEWLTQCIDQNNLIDPNEFKPADFHQILQESSFKDSIDKLNMIEKKRKSPSKTDQEQYLSQNISPIKSKRKIKASGKKPQGRSGKIQKELNLLNQIQTEGADLNTSIFDREELDKTIQQIQQEKFFMKEFAKDLRKFNKKQNEILLEDQQKPKKKEVKYMSKNQLIDSYIEGDIDTANFIQQMGTKIKDKKHGKNKSQHAQGMKRMTEIFKSNFTKNAKDRDQIEDNDDADDLDNNNIVNRTIVTLNDFLVDIDKENNPPSQDNFIKTTQMKQTNLCFQKSLDNNNIKIQKSIFNYNPVNFITHQLKQIEEIPRLTKSSTFNVQMQNKQENVHLLLEEENDQELKQSLEEFNNNKENTSNTINTPRINLLSRRANSLQPSKYLKAYLLQDYETKQKMQMNSQEDDQGMQFKRISKSGQKESKERMRKKKQREKILPSRKMPSRGCKLNVNYVEEEENDYIQKMIYRKRINF